VLPQGIFRGHLNAGRFASQGDSYTMTTRTPLVTIQTVTEALRAIRFGKPLGYGHPIAQLFQLSSKSYLHQYVDADIYADLFVYRRIPKLLRSQLNYLRRLHALGPVLEQAPMTEVLHNLTEDFQQADTVLEAWSIVFCLYGRSDLDITTDRLCLHTNQTERTLQRRQKQGIERFTRFLLCYELRIRLKLGLVTMTEQAD